MFNDYEIRRIPLSLKHHREQVEGFLKDNGLRSDPMDYYAGVFAYREDEILGGGGLCGNVIKCLAVKESLRDEGISVRLVSHLISVAVNNGHTSVRLFTKPENKLKFESLGFTLIAESPKAILMEIGNAGITAYSRYLSILKRDGTNGAIVMNANPFTLGHKYLIEEAARQVDNLYVIVVKEDVSMFSYEERKNMVKEGCKAIGNVIVCEGSDYAVSALTFPTYFMKEVTDATETHIHIDLDIFANHIAPALNITVRFVGSEPTDRLTNRYNEKMKALLPLHQIEVRQVERLRQSGNVVSASALRRALTEGSFAAACDMAAPTSVPYLIMQAAVDALQTELDLTPKPGLVDLHDNGAHNDMNHALMTKSIRTLRPFIAKFAVKGFRRSCPGHDELAATGIKAEQAMFEATGGVNTHKGALFALGLVAVVASHHYYIYRQLDAPTLQRGIEQLAQRFQAARDTHGYEVKKNNRLAGALDNAQTGYATLFTEWLPFINSLGDDPSGLHRLLLCIMSRLDDTNICYRKGEATLQAVKKEAQERLDDFTVESLQAMNRRFIADNISPGGSADMLALTVFIRTILS